jgi:GDP/UDP-N,N'-diacetylbacillosamine 2-epimerase (hydrolysing)
MKKICVITGSRAEYGLLKRLMSGLSSSPKVEMTLVVTGAHLSPEFGMTYKEIEQDGFAIDYKVEMITSSDTPVGIAKSMGLGLIGIADALDKLRPDLLVLLGDRFEMLAAATVALLARVPIAHLHGGEKTEGAIDEAIRHSITKMSQLHFVAAEEYRHRVVQLGESPDRVFVVGGLGVDAISNVNLLSRSELEKNLDFKFGRKNLLVTYHPVTLERDTAAAQMTELLEALATLEDTHLIFTLPNADTDGRVIIKMIETFVSGRKNACAFQSLGQRRYFSCLAQVDAVVGNSSSGLGEMPTFGKGTINIGDRQKGRLQAKSVINCEPLRSEIIRSIDYLYSDDFKCQLESSENPYGQGGASEKILELLETLPLTGLIKKQFYDLR